MFLPTGVLALASLFCTGARTQNSAYDPASSATAVATSLPADVYPDSGYLKLRIRPPFLRGPRNLSRRKQWFLSHLQLHVESS
jgi:hypothetical protein